MQYSNSSETGSQLPALTDDSAALTSATESGANKLLVQNPSHQNPEKEVLEKEVNGPKGLEPTRYGDWESKGRCHDF